MKIPLSELNGILKRLSQRIIDFNLPFESQMGCGSGNNRWSSDFWHREVISCLIEGIPGYRNLPIPDYLKNNESFSKPEIERAVCWKMDMLDCIEVNIDFSDTLIVSEIGWGIDLILCSTLKDWKKIIAYDGCQLMIKEAESFLREVGFDINIDLESSTGKDFLSIEDKVVLVANHSHIPFETLEKVANKDNTLSIIDGLTLKPGVKICQSLR